MLTKEFEDASELKKQFRRAQRLSDRPLVALGLAVASSSLGASPSVA